MRGRGGEKHLDRVEETLCEGERGKRGGAFRPSGGDLK